MKGFVANNSKDLDDLLGTKFDPSGLRRDDLFYDDEKNIIHPILRIKLVCLGKSGERWEILENKKIVLSIPSYRFSKKEKKYLYGFDGMQQMLKLYKQGFCNVLHLKKKLKEDGLI